ncbi:MAG: c-type cytochrome [Zavarzinella sp.]
MHSLKRLFYAVIILCGIVPIGFAQLSPQDALKAMKVADGLEVTLFAAEPQLLNPTSMDIDPAGRVWVTEAVNYRRVNFRKPILRPEGDQIVVLVDTDGDGKADESKVFYQGKDLYGPLGIAVLPSADGKSFKVFVCQSPDILLFEDNDGDLKADGPPTKFLTNFKGFDHDHGVHGINIGPDGKLYFTVGDAGVDGLQARNGKGPKFTTNRTDCQAATVWRCDIEGNNLELIAHNFRNNYECCVNSFGDVWLSDNDDDGNQQTRICQVMPGGNYGYWPRNRGDHHWHENMPGVVHKTMRTGFGSPTGICFYEGKLLPSKYFGQLLHTDAGPRELRCFHIKVAGAGFTLEKEVLVTSTDNWFRLSDVCVAPDGSILMADWYDPGVGGHGMGDWTRGRIYRLTPKGHKGYQHSRVSISKPSDLPEFLNSPCLSTRAMAIQYLQTLKLPEAYEALRTCPQENPYDHARVSWQIAQLSKRDEPQTKPVGLGILHHLEGLLASEHPELRNLATRIYRDQQFFHRPEDFDPELSKQILVVKTPATQREVILGLRHFPVEQAKPFFYDFAKKYDGQDRFYLSALNIACGTDPARRSALLADFPKHFPIWNATVANLVWELQPPSILPQLPEYLEDPKLPATEKAQIVSILATSSDIKSAQVLLELLIKGQSEPIQQQCVSNLVEFLPTKWATVKTTPEYQQAISQLLKNEKTQPIAFVLIAASNDHVNSQAIVDVASNAKSPTKVRKDAILALGKIKSQKAVTTLSLLVDDQAVAEAATNALGNQLEGRKLSPVGQSAMQKLQQILTAPHPSRAVQQAALNSLAAAYAGCEWLLDQQESGKLPKNLLADTGRLLRNNPYQGLRNRALTLFPAPGKLDPKKLPPISELVLKHGNATRGKEIFKQSLKGDAQCMRCHMVGGQGGQIGPDLSMIGKKAAGKQNLYESILDPNKAIADQYVQWKVSTLDGQSLSGLLVAENEKNLTLRDANGKDTTIKKDDLAEDKAKSLISLMPDNLVATLTEEELVDMVEYLLTLTTPSMTPDHWKILGPFPNDASDSALDTDFGPESGSINFEGNYVGKAKQEIRWSTVRPNGSGYLDLAAHYGDNGANSASYLYQSVTSTGKQKATLAVGNDDGAIIWVNGKKVFTNRDHFAATPGKHQIAVELKEGKNEILIKIVNGNNPHGLYFAIQSELELQLSK